MGDSRRSRVDWLFNETPSLDSEPVTTDSNAPTPFSGAPDLRPVQRKRMNGMVKRFRSALEILGDLDQGRAR